MRRSNGFWEGAETNQSPGSRPRPDAADLCDSLTWTRERRVALVAAAKEAPDCVVELVGSFDVAEMTGVGQHDELGA
jgi:hypothetical protein